MPSTQEISASIYGAWRLALVDRSGMKWFNHSIEGFWRSFFVAFLVAPLFALAVAFQLIGSTAEFDLSDRIVAELFSYALSWILFPLIVLLVCRLMGLTDFYVSYIIVFNWSHVISATIVLPVLLPLALDMIPRGFGETMLLFVAFAIFTYRWFIARVALGADGFTAAALVVLEVLLALFIEITVGHAT